MENLTLVQLITADIIVLSVFFAITSLFAEKEHQKLMNLISKKC